MSSKENKQSVRLAIDADSREIVGVFLGDRSRQSATNLWLSLPPVYRQHGICYTDFWEAYQQVLRPQASEKPLAHKREKPVIQERFNNTLRQRVGRLVRKTLSFSKKLSNHIGAIWYFVHHYNASLRSLPLLFTTTRILGTAAANKFITLPRIVPQQSIAASDLYIDSVVLLPESTQYQEL